MQEVTYTGITNAETEIYDHTGNNWSHRNGNKRLKENSEAISGKGSIDSVVHMTATLGTSQTIWEVLQSET